MAVTVESVNIQGLHRVVGLFLASAREFGLPVTPETGAIVTAHLTTLLASGQGDVFAAWPGGRELPVPVNWLPVGILLIAGAFDPFYGPHLVVRDLYVEPHHRHQGVAYALLRTAVLDFPEGDCSLVFSTRGRLPRSYRRLGARPLYRLWGSTLAQARAGLRLPAGEKEYEWVEPPSRSLAAPSAS